MTVKVTPTRVIARGSWETDGGVTMMDTTELPPLLPLVPAATWEVGQLVEVQPRTWAG